MRAIIVGLCGVMIVGLYGFVAWGQGGLQVAQEAPTDRAVVFSALDLETRFAQMASKGPRGTWRLLEGKTHNLNIRRDNTDSPSMHPNTVDVWVVRQGSGTLVTGGEIVEVEGGRTIRGGVEEEINVGDIVFIPAGLPHTVIPHGIITWMNIRYDMVR